MAVLHKFFERYLTYRYYLEQFALNETLYTAVRLLQEFSAIESRDPRPWTENVGATVCSANGVQVAMVSKTGTLVA